MRWLREPLLHFLLLGAAIFWIASLVGDPAAVRPERVEITAGDIEQLATGFERTWQRPPSETELAGLIEERVREEILYREALALGLDRDDTIVRRRLRQKLEFLAEDVGGEALPSDAELAAHLAANADRFRSEPRLAFRQVFLSRDRRGEKLERDALRLLAELRAGDAGVDPLALSDPLPLPADSAGSSERELAGRFGGAFAARLFELAPGAWQGPVESAYGLHLVFVRDRTEGRMPALDEVRDAVANEWRAESRTRARDRFYRELRGRYEVRVEPSAAGVGARPGTREGS